MENKCKRFLSLLLALTMVIGMIPFGHVHAEDEETVVTFEKVTAVQANEEYVIFYAGTNRAMANSTRTWAKGAGMDTGVISAPSENYLWTLVPVDDVEDGYMIYNSAAAKYITIDQNNAALSEGSGHVFKFTYTENGFVIKAEGVEYGYFNNLGGENIVGGWNSDGTKFDVCKVVELTLSEAELPGKAFWTEVSVDTETIYDANEGQFEYAWDNDSATIWHSNWQGGVSDKLDAEGETFSGEIDFGKEYTINWFSFTPRQGNNSGQVTQASLYVKGAEDTDWTLAGQNLTFAEDQTEKKISFEEKAVRYVKFVAEASNDGWVAVSEFNIGYDAPDPVEPTDPTEPTDPVEPENAFTSVLISGITGTASSNDDGDGSAVEEAFDGIKDDNGNYWASVNNAGGIEGNEYLIANLGGKHLINQVAYTRRTAGATAVGNLKDYVIWVSTDGEAWEKVAEGTMEDAATVTIPFTPVEATHVKLTATQSHHWQEANLNKVMAVAEFEVFQAVCETHTPGEAATCTTAQTCTVCHAELAPATGHTWDNDCDADCNTCGQIREAAHNYIAEVTDPTCTAAGSATYTCDRCGDTYTEEIPATGHVNTTTGAVNPTLCLPGQTGTTVCATCGETIGEDTQIGELPVATVLNGDTLIALSDCEYTYNPGSFTHANADGTTYYVKPAANGAMIPQTTEEFTGLTLHWQADGTVQFSGNGSLHFHIEAEKPYWNKCGNGNGIISTDTANHNLYIFAPGNGTDIPGYTQVTSADGLVSDGNYLIAAKNNAGNWYVMVPSATAEKYDHIALVSNELRPVAHVYGDTVIENQVEPTCTKEGSYETVCYCTICGVELNRTHYTTPPIEHTRSEAVAENRFEPTCTMEGSYESVVYCSVCNYEVSRDRVTIPATGHTEGEAAIENQFDPTCTMDGVYETVVRCTVCNEIVTSETTTVPATGHTEGEAVVENNVEPTLNSEGSYDSVVYCSVCNEELSRVTVTTPTLTGAVAQIGQVKYESFDAALAAAQTGDTIYLLDPNGVEIAADTTYNLSGLTIESEGDVFVVTGGTLTLNGSGTVKGGTSGTGSWTAIWANGGHVVINGGTYSVGGDSTATETSHQNDVIYTKNGGTVTINGGTFLNDGTVWTLNENDANRGTITVYGGTFQNWNPADNSSEGAHTSFLAEGCCAAEANGTYTVQAHAYESVVTAPTCTDKGYTTYTCVHCGDTYTADQVDALGHTEGEAIVENEVDAICTKDGSYDTVTYCSVCGEEVTRDTTTIPATGHTAGEAVVENNVEPTLNSEGSYDTVVYCTVCDAELSRVTTIVPALTGAVAQIGETKYASFEEALAAAVDGDTIVLLSKDGIEITEDTTYDLSGLTVESEGDVFVVTGGTLTLNGSGTVKGGTSGTGSWTAIWANGGHVVINGGTYSVGGDSTATETSHQNDVIYTKNGGTVTINGGTFLNDGTVWTLNENDANRGTITVYGGTFQNWNPADNSSEGAHTSFLAEGCCAAEANGTYTVQAHAYESVVTAPTCTEAGFTTYTCVHCGDTYTADQVDALGHTEGEAIVENEVDATCTKDGSYNTVVYCSVCDEEVSRVTTTVPATGHTAGEAVVENNVEPTLNSEGSYDTVVYCTVCDAELSRVTTTVPALTGAVAQIGETKYASFEEALAAAEAGDTIVILVKDGIEITEDTTYDLTGLTVESEGDVFVVTGGTLTLNGSGTVKGGTAGTGSWTAIWANGGNVVINGGTYSVGGDSTATETDHQNDVIYTKNGGTVTINGGTFLNDGTVWTLNENDANRGTITVYGGTFENWNPADNSSEGAHTSFLAEGYCSAEANGTYTVQAHDYEGFVTAPTCTDKGYTTYTCVHCGDSYTADETPALGHAFENGTCTICGTGIAVNLTTGSTYAVLADALNAAVAGDTVQLLGDTFESNVLVYPEITLDLNSNDLTADYVVGFIDSHILDGKGGGKLIAAERNVVVDKNNKMIPLYDENGFVFTTVGFTLRRDENYTGEGIKINALVLPQDMYAVDLLRDGAADNHIQIMIRLSWDAADSVGSQNFLFKDEVVQAVYSSNKGSTSVGSYGQMFTMIVTGIENVENLRANIVIVSDTNTERTPDSVSIYE